MALTKRQANRGKTTTRRKETNEQLMEQTLERYGYLSMRVTFSVKDGKGVYRGMKGESIVIRKVPTEEQFKALISAVRNRIVHFVKEGV